MTDSAALAHLESAEREARIVTDLPADTPVRPIRSAAVVGAGTMGSGIAMCFANAGIPVQLFDSEPAAVDRGLASIARVYGAAEAKGRQSREDTERRLATIARATGVEAFGDVDVVVEAAFEDMDVKRGVFARLDAACRADAILATNTSSLDVTALARGTAHPSRVVGMHFFSPAHVMRLIEIVRPAQVDAAVLATTMRLAHTLGKIGVVVGVCDGFVGNRLLFAYRQQANFLLEEGATPEQIDRALTAFGLPMGPYQMGDLAGLDISWRIRKRQAATRPPHLRYSRIADILCERGRFGQKTGAGWYRYAPGSREPIPDPEVTALIVSMSAELGIERRVITDDEIVQRCLFPLVNEGARVLEEGIAARAGDIDVIWVYGYGFPRTKGGPMFWARTVGFDRIRALVARLHDEQGELVVPSRLLHDLVESGRTDWP